MQPAGTVRLTAAHDYGTLDIGIRAGANWVTFTIENISAWHADPLQKHLRLATMCPVDMCPNSTADGRTNGSISHRRLSYGHQDQLMTVKPL